MSRVYTCFCTASIHKGHLNVIAAMQSVAEDLLRHHRALELDARLLPFRKIITLIDS